MTSISGIYLKHSCVGLFVVLYWCLLCESKIFGEGNNDIDCEIKKNFKASTLQIGKSTIDHFGKEGNLKNADDSTKHKKDNLQLFHCKCTFDDDEWVRGSLEDSDTDDLDDDFVDDDDEDWGDWKKSEILKISDCDELILKFKESNGIQSEMGNTILIVENVKKLEMDFLMGPADSRFSSVYLRNVTFSDENENSLEFGETNDPMADATELLFENINFSKGSFTIKALNTKTDSTDKDHAVDPMITISNSTIGSAFDIGNVQDSEVTFTILVANAQKDKTCIKKVTNDKDDEKEDDCTDEDGCWFDYMGKINITRNRFTFLGEEAITIINANTFGFSENTVEANVNNALFITSVKNLNISMNRFELAAKDPTLHLVYKYSATDLENFDYFPQNFPSSTRWKESKFEDSCGDEDEAKFASLTANDISKVEIMKNWFNKLNDETIKFKIDEKYDKKFVMEKFAPEETSSQRPCKCPIPELEEEDDINVNLTRITFKMQHCLSPRFPPVLGSRVDICQGKYPKAHHELVNEAKNGGIRPWHLVLAVLLAIVLTAVIVFVVVRFCCMSEESKSRTVSPNP